MLVFSSPATQDEERWSLVTASETGSIRIAAIDNGLAFPFKHPDQWRTCELAETVGVMCSSNKY